MKPKGCKKFYIPWICGTCMLKKRCKPNAPKKYERKKVVA